MVERLLKYDDAAAILNIGKTKLYQLARDGKVPYVKMDGNVRFRESDLRKYIESCTVQPKQVG